jgi:hypothetical protein
MTNEHNDTPDPYRSPLPYHTPIVTQIPTITNPNAEVQVSIPNEEPATEDDLTLNFTFTGEGLIIDAMVSDGDVIGTTGRTYEEWFDAIMGEHIPSVAPSGPVETGYGPDVDALVATGLAARENREAVDSPRSKVAALSADLREALTDNEADDWPAEQTIDLLDAIDAMLGEGDR